MTGPKFAELVSAYFEREEGFSDTHRAIQIAMSVGAINPVWLALADKCEISVEQLMGCLMQSESLKGLWVSESHREFATKLLEERMIAESSTYSVLDLMKAVFNRPHHFSPTEGEVRLMALLSDTRLR